MLCSFLNPAFMRADDFVPLRHRPRDVLQVAEDCGSRIVNVVRPG